MTERMNPITSIQAALASIYATALHTEEGDMQVTMIPTRVALDLIEALELLLVEPQGTS